MTADLPWSAPTASEPVDAVVEVPGSKSHTNRALLLAAHTRSRVVALEQPLRARDTLLMVGALRALGAEVTDTAHGWAVDARGLGATGATEVDCGNAGTVARFLPPLAATLGAPVRFDGDARMRERPLGPLLAALRELGARVDDTGGALPATVSGPAHGGGVTIDASASSQLVSGLLLSAARFRQGLELRHVGPPVPSAPHVAMTVDALQRAGVEVRTDGGARWSVAPGEVTQPDVVIEPDLSTASAFLAAAAATGGRVLLRHWPASSLQPGALTPGVLEQLGCRCTTTSEGLEVTGPAELDGVDVDLRDNPELVPTLTALAVLARTPSRIRGVAHTRLQETDRLLALATELGKAGARIDVTDDGLAIEPTVLHGHAVLDPQADHRLAMAYAVVGLRVPGLQVLDVETTAKTLPGFPERWAALLGGG